MNTPARYTQSIVNTCLKTAGYVAIACTLNCAQAQSDLQKLLSTPIEIERHASTATLPLRERGGKLFVSAEVGGVMQEFIFDTGSPTILTRALADRLNLPIVGQNTGADANGTPVTLDYALADQITLGSVTFRSVPVLVSDFASAPMAECFFDGGILGSEILAGSAWRIDLENHKLTVAASADDLAFSPDAKRLPLEVTPYPYMPIISYGLGEINDKALFDTGSAEPLSVFLPVLKHRSVQALITADSRRVGRGSEGVSAGGMGATMDLLRFEISDFRMGKTTLGPLSGISRSQPPTLLGAGLLWQHTITLDYQAKAFILEPRQTPRARQPSPGFSVMVTEDRATVVQLYNHSKAAGAGLMLGDIVLEMNGESLDVTTADTRCKLARRLAYTRDLASVTELVVARDGVNHSIQWSQ